MTTKRKKAAAPSPRFSFNHADAWIVTKHAAFIFCLAAPWVAAGIWWPAITPAIAPIAIMMCSVVVKLLTVFVTGDPK